MARGSGARCHSHLVDEALRNGFCLTEHFLEICGLTLKLSSFWSEWRRRLSQAAAVEPWLADVTGAVPVSVRDWYNTSKFSPSCTFDVLLWLPS